MNDCKNIKFLRFYEIYPEKAFLFLLTHTIYSILSLLIFTNFLQLYSIRKRNKFFIIYTKDISSDQYTTLTPHHKQGEVNNYKLSLSE